jgi:hypothetical protein
VLADTADGELVARVLHGERDLFDLLFDRYAVRSTTSLIASATPPLRPWI